MLDEGGKLAWEYSSVRRCARESLREVSCGLNYLRPLKAVLPALWEVSAASLRASAGQAWQEGPAEQQPWELLLLCTDT